MSYSQPFGSIFQKVKFPSLQIIRLLLNNLCVSRKLRPHQVGGMFYCPLYNLRRDLRYSGSLFCVILFGRIFFPHPRQNLSFQVN